MARRDVLLPRRRSRVARVAATAARRRRLGGGGRGRGRRPRAARGVKDGELETMCFQIFPDYCKTVNMGYREVDINYFHKIRCIDYFQFCWPDLLQLSFTYTLVFDVWNDGHESGY